jgi:ABC-2 type transport system permease protein
VAEALRTEFLTLRKRPMTWVLFLLMIADVLFWHYFLAYGTWLQIQAHLITVPPFLTSPTSQDFSTMQMIRAIGEQSGDIGDMALILGALAAGSGYEWGTVKTEFTAGRRRLTLVLAQYCVLALLAAPVVVLLFAIAVGLSFLIAVVGHFPRFWPPVWQFPAAMGALYLTILINSAFGMVLAILTRSAAVATGLGLSYGFVLGAILQPLPLAVVSAIGSRDPFTNVAGLFDIFGPLGGGPTERVYMPGVSGGIRSVLTVVAFLLVFLAVASFAASRRDVQ